MKDSIESHEEYIDYIEECFGELQSINAYRVLSFLEFGNKNAIPRVSSNPHSGLTAYYSLPATKRWAGIMTGKDKILLLADNDLVEKFKGNIEQQGLEVLSLSISRGAAVIPTTADGGMIDEDGYLTLDMQFVTDFAKFCLSDSTPPFGEL